MSLSMVARGALAVEMAVTGENGSSTGVSFFVPRRCLARGKEGTLSGYSLHMKTSARWREAGSLRSVTSPTSLVHCSEHPLIALRLTRLRAATTPNAEFRQLIEEITTYLAYEAMGDLQLRSVMIDTPVERNVSSSVLDEVPVIIPILRAGLGMAAAVERAVTQSRLCLLGLRRNETTLQPEIYHDGIPMDLSGTHVIVCDPMLATGGSLLHALQLVTARGATTITAICILAAQAGVDAVTTQFPNVALHVAAIDGVLNEHGYIVPGLGDAGDRQFGPPVHNP